MAFIPIPGCASAVIEGSYYSNPIITVLHFAKAGGGDFSASDCAALAGIVATAWPFFMLPVMSNQYSFISAKVTDQSDEFGPSSTVSAFPPVFGAQTSPGLPGHTTLVMTHRTALRGRSFRGRTYMPGLTEDGVVGNTVEAARSLALGTAFNDFMADVTGAGYVFVIASRYTGNAPRVTGLATPVTSSGFRDNIVDSQRRRSQV